MPAYDYIRKRIEAVIILEIMIELTGGVILISLMITSRVEIERPNVSISDAA